MIAYRYEGEGAFTALPRFKAEADKIFVVGEVYLMEPHEDRSGISHRHFFASVREAWINLREVDAERFRSPEALRKYCLIRAGYADSSTIVAASKAEAHRLAAFIRPTDEFAVVSVQGATVTRWTAQSQSQKAMGKTAFQASKEAVLGILEELLGTTPGDLAKHAEAA